MSRIEDTMIDYGHWIADIDTLFCAAYALKYDKDLTLLAGNEAFFKLLGHTKKDVHLKYGNRLATLLDATPLKQFGTLKKGESISVAHCIQRVNTTNDDVFLDVSVWAQGSKDGIILCCVAIDITNYERIKENLLCYEEGIGIASKQTGVDYIQYNLKTKQAQVLSDSKSILAPICEARQICPDFVSTLISEGIVPKEFEKTIHTAFKGVDKNDSKSMCEIQMKDADGTLMWVRLSVIRKDDKVSAVAIFEDITQERQTMYNYLNETQFFQAMLSEKDAFAQVDADENKITRIGGMWNLYNEIIDKVSYSELITEFINKVVHPEDREHYLEVMQCDNFIESLGNGIDQVGCQFRRIADQNKMVWMDLSVFLFRNPLTQHVHALLTIKNIDEKKKQEIFLLRASRFDQLTDMYNKKVSEELIKEHLVKMGDSEQAAFIILDMDNFKYINDQQGHQVGDRVLSHFASLLSSTFRQSDIMGRFGGDEFIIFLKNINDVSVVEKKLEALYETLENDHEHGLITCSAGVALTQGSIEYELLFQKADYALYQSKGAGKNQFFIYDESAADDMMHRKVPVERDKLEGDANIQISQENFIDEIPTKEGSGTDFDSFVGERGDIAYIVDSNTFELVCGNQAFFDRIGLSESQCVKKKCYELMHKRDSPCPFCGRANWTTDKYYLWRNYNYALEQEFLIKNRLVNWENEEMLLTIAVDLSNNKSIVDSMDNADMETHSILSGVQQMADATSLSDAMTSGMEAIASFFRAQAVRLWQYQPAHLKHVPVYEWRHEKSEELSFSDTKKINTWLSGRSFEQPVVLESAEAMLAYSYEMFQYMKENNIKNQRWIQIKEKDEVLGCISIDNISSNFQNVAFLESFGVFIASDLRKRSLMEEALYSQEHDTLTDLRSRKSYEDYMMTYEADLVDSMGLFVGNIDNLKGINSTKGFQTGNYYITLFANMLKDVFEGHIIFRLDGDEFLVLAPNITSNEADAYVHKIGAMIQKDGLFSVSIGSAWDDIEKDVRELSEQAIQMMKINKKQHYGVNPQSADADHRKMLGDLISSIENGEFEVFLQPKVELKDSALIGAEALIRYKHKEQGYLPPATFIGTLEKNNLIRYIDLFVFEEVCKQLEQWKKESKFLPIVSLNFSRLTLLERDLLQSMEFILAKYDVAKENIEVEVTESIANMGKTAVYQVARDIYNAGYAVALDDFGTKYTNLAILSELDFSMLKIDRSLVDKLGTRENLGLILKNVIHMCKELNIDVIAEGIETKEQEEILKALGCTYGQGYLYGAPMPISVFEKKYLLK